MGIAADANDSVSSTVLSEKQGKYSEDALPEFTPMTWNISEIRAAIPPHLFVRQTWKGFLYLARDVLFVIAFWTLALRIDPFFQSEAVIEKLTAPGAEILRWTAWSTYWWFQGLVFTGIWVIGHECGHDAFSANKRICDIVGYITHTLLWTPYFNWKIQHQRHHATHGSMEREEENIPLTRSEVGLPVDENHEFNYEEHFGDTPIYTLYQLAKMQLLAFPTYGVLILTGGKVYPKLTNHCNQIPVSINRRQLNAIVVSNIGIMAMIYSVKWASVIWSFSAVLKYYGVPWFLVTHWFIIITYLHHTDAAVPHYRKGAWNFQRGAAATIDRPFLGWQGRFFLHDVAHYHVVHHFFSRMPFYHAPEATKYLKEFLGPHYCYSDKPVFKAYWENFTQCKFVEDDGDVLFWRNNKGEALYRPAASTRHT